MKRAREKRSSFKARKQAQRRLPEKAALPTSGWNRYWQGGPWKKECPRERRGEKIESPKKADERGEAERALD